MNNKSYNGWTNYETWNVALWIQNDEGLYNLARRFRHKPNPYECFIAQMRELGSLETGDQVAWNDSSINVDEINEMMGEL